MIIISDLRGQLCNRIFLTAYGMAIANGSGQRLIDFSLNEYAALFPATRRMKLFEWPYKVLRLLVRAIVKTLWRLPIGRTFIIDVTYQNSEQCSPGNANFMAKIKRRRLTFIRVAGYFDLSKIVLPETETIRAKFAPDPEITRMARAHATAARRGADVLIGIHIRRRDYDMHLNGKHFYPVKFYREAMDQMVRILPGKKTAFLICSDEALPMDLFSPLQVMMGPGTVLGDLYGLAECDYLLGPPSTYSLWAAFYGRKPIFQMFRKEVPSHLEQFMVPDGHFECYDLNSV